MTMFKTPQEIEVKWVQVKNPEDTDYEKEFYTEGYSQCQKDIQEASIEGFEEWFRQTVEPVMIKSGYGLIARLKEMAELEVAFEAGKLSSMKELQEKNEEIERLKKKISSFDAYASADEKYQEAVKDIEVLLDTRERLRSKSVSMRAFEIMDKVFNPIRAKYNLDKKEG